MLKETVLRIVALLLAALGLVVIWQSTVWGLKAAPGIIMQIGSVSGDMPHQIVYQGPVISLQIIGAILFGIGLWRVVVNSQKGS